MNILISGATGFIGTRLCRQLGEDGHNVSALSRDPASAVRLLPLLRRVSPWDPLISRPPEEAFENIDAVVHLAGESVAGRWHAAKKRAIRESRILGTRHLVAGIESLGAKPKVLISASAIGYYGNRGEELLDEEAPPGAGFLSEVCQAWEGEAARAEELGLRVVCLRSGIVLGAGGGALATMLPPFKLGLGGPLGSGHQWWSWVHLDDVIGIITEALEDETLEGPLNLTAPRPLRQEEFARALGQVLGRPALLPAPAWVLKLALGEFAGELLASQRVLPRQIQAQGYHFRFGELEPALRQTLGR